MKKDCGDYDDVINLSNPTSTVHPRMSLHDRAAQFSPFAALTGYEAAIREEDRLTEKKQELSEEMRDLLNEQLRKIKENIKTEQTVTITYFVPDDKKEGGAYVSHSGIIKKIDGYERKVIFMDQTVIPMDQIKQITASSK